jgi:transcriptional regulator with XRE-family HTH domain
MSSHPSVHHVLDGELVRRRRGELGLTESYLGALCGVSSSVIRRLESGFHQDDLSMRFIAHLVDALGVPLSALVIDPPTAPAPESTGDEPTDAARLGAVLATAREPVPLEAACAVLDWDTERLDAAAASLNQALEHTGQVLVDAGDALSIAADVTPIDAATANAAVRAAFMRRRPNLPELRIVHRLAEGVVVRREDLDTARGMAISRLRAAGVLAPARKVNTEGDPPELSDDVRYSLLL